MPLHTHSLASSSVFGIAAIPHLLQCVGNLPRESEIIIEHHPRGTNLLEGFNYVPSFDAPCSVGSCRRRCLFPNLCVCKSARPPLDLRCCRRRNRYLPVFLHTASRLSEISAMATFFPPFLQEVQYLRHPLPPKRRHLSRKMQPRTRDHPQASLIVFQTVQRAITNKSSQLRRSSAL